LRASPARKLPEARAASDAGLLANSTRNGTSSLRRRLLGLAADGRVRPRPEELDTLGDYFRALALASTVFALEFSRAQPAFNIYLLSFAEILRTGFSEFSDNDNVVPLNPLLTVAVLAGEGFVVATEKPVTGCPLAGRYRSSGSCPRWPMIVALFNDICLPPCPLRS